MTKQQQPRKLRIIFIQCFIITLLLYLILLFCKIDHDNILIAAIGSSSFTIFAMPKTKQAKSKNVLCSYCIGIFVGIVCFYFKTIFLKQTVLSEIVITELTSALAIGNAILLMLLFKYEHSPAVGIALALVVNPWRLSTLVTIMTLVVSILLTKYVVRHYLHDLIAY